MNTDTVTSWLGLAQAIGAAALTFYMTSQDDGSFGWTNPMFWVGFSVAVLMAVKGYYTNKPSVPSA